MLERCNTYITHCRACGESHRGNWYPELSAELVARQLCWWCHFWLGHVARCDDPRQARIHGTLYYVLPDDPQRDPRGLGFGGGTHHIRFTDGREDACVRTRNLWTQGEIPGRFQGRLPDNAVFTDHRWEGGRSGYGVRSHADWAETAKHIDEVLDIRSRPTRRPQSRAAGRGEEARAGS